MAERRRGKTKRQQEVPEKLTKDEKAVAKYLRFSVPNKEGKLVGLPVQYFLGSDAVNSLLDSKWAASKNKSSPLFSNRASCVDFCQTLLLKGIFHRAARVEKLARDKTRDKKKRKMKDETEDGGRKDDDKCKKSRDDRKDEKKDEEKKVDKSQETDSLKDENKEEKKKKKREKKVKLEMVDHQVFKDGDEIFVWIFDPVPVKTFIIGLFLVLGAIGVCLFPLWPPEVRLGVYYLSLSVAGLIGSLLVLCIVRVILFGLIWLLTFGRHHFWFLPNLNEDVGFFDSFKPLYHHEHKTGQTKEKSNATDEKMEEEERSEENSVQRDKKESNDDINEDLNEDNGYEMVDADSLPLDTANVEAKNVE